MRHSVSQPTIVPRGALRVLGKVLKHASGDVTWRFGDAENKQRCSFEARSAGGKVTVMTRMIDGTFPDVNRVIPSDMGKHYRVEPVDSERSDFVARFWHPFDRSYPSAQEANDDARANYQGSAAAAAAWQVVEHVDPTWTVETEAFGAAVMQAASVATDRSRAVKLSVASDTMTVEAKSPDGGSMIAKAPCQGQVSEVFEIGFNARYLLDFCAIAERLSFQARQSSDPALITDPDDTRRLFLLMPMRV
jgi:DNA polymerase III sliding clamp (beta) subunit (PCNA family)